MSKSFSLLIGASQQKFPFFAQKVQLKMMLDLLLGRKLFCRLSG
jgi:hypothetical protein